MAIYNENLYIWRSNLDDGSNTIPLVDTGTSSIEYGLDMQSFSIKINTYNYNYNM